MKITDEKLDELLGREEAPDFSREFEYHERENITAPKNCRATFVYLIAAVLAAAIFASVPVVLSLNRAGEIINNDTTPIESANGSDSAGKEQSGKPDDSSGKENAYPTVAEWYAPGILIANSVTRLADTPIIGTYAESANEPECRIITLAHYDWGLNNYNNSRIPELANGELAQIVGSRHIDVTGLLESSPHKDHGCLIYDITRGEAVCYVCLAKEKLGRELNENESVVIDDLVTYDVMSFAVYNDLENRIIERHLYDMTTDTLTDVPVLSRNDFGMFKASADMKFIITHEIREDSADYNDNPYDDVYLIETDTMEYKNISGGYPTSYESTISPDGKNVLISLKNEYGEFYGFETNQCEFLLTNTQTLAQCTGAGMVLSYADDMLVTDYRGTYHIYDRVECVEITPTEPVYAWEIKEGELIWVNATDGSETPLRPAPDGWLISNDGKYAYGYTTGDDHITCFSLYKNDSFDVALSEEFVSEIRRISSDEKIWYQLHTNESMDEILICYYSD